MARPTSRSVTQGVREDRPLDAELSLCDPSGATLVRGSESRPACGCPYFILPGSGQVRASACPVRRNRTGRCSVLNGDRGQALPGSPSDGNLEFIVAGVTAARRRTVVAAVLVAATAGCASGH